jgi:hypothetical protein
MNVPRFYFIIVRLLTMLSLMKCVRLAAQAVVMPVRRFQTGKAMRMQA